MGEEKEGGLKLKSYQVEIRESGPFTVSETGTGRHAFRKGGKGWRGRSREGHSRGFELCTIGGLIV